MKINKILNKFYSLKHPEIEKDLQHYEELLQEIKNRSMSLESISDASLNEKASELSKLSKNSTVRQFTINGFAIIYQAIKRKLRMTPYDVQIIGGLALYENKLIEMQTGEGKTLTAIFPAAMNAFTHKGVHVLTFNDYLAQRDAAWMQPVYELLNLSAGYISSKMSKDEKRRMYNCDITYATAKEAGFDFLRQFIAYSHDEIIQRPFHYAIIDEADAILIDEARNPLVLAGDILIRDIDIYAISGLVAKFQYQQHFDFDKYSRNIFLTNNGIARVEREFGITNLMADENLTLHSAVNLAVHAKHLLKKDIDYVVKDGEIKLVDELTGRIVDDRKWRNGLQSAVEAKEGLTAKSEGAILNMITLQHFINQYPKKAGMTATAQNSSMEFSDMYGLPVVVIPPAKPCKRIDYPDEIYYNLRDKNEALLKEVKHVHQTGQPVLIGTLSVKESEELAHMFEKEGISCQVLNAKNDALEASIIADAGKSFSVTISTNMAGRGTDILLGGKNSSEKNNVIGKGGLYVMGTNRHESRRIDFQLRGRAGRQGDVGISRFFISMEDALMVKFRLKDAIPPKYINTDSKDTINVKIVRKFIDHIQRVIEGQMYDTSKTLIKYSGFIEKQRQILQNERQNILLDAKCIFSLFNVNKECQSFISNIPDGLEKLQAYILSLYDKYWALHIDFTQQVRDGIHLVRIGGLDPVFEFHKKASENFDNICNSLDAAIKDAIMQIMQDPGCITKGFQISKPSSTWTYVINDNPFGKEISAFLLSNSNIGFQVDILSNMILGVYGFFQKFRKKKPETED